MSELPMIQVIFMRPSHGLIWKRARDTHVIVSTLVLGLFCYHYEKVTCHRLPTPSALSFRSYEHTYWHAAAIKYHMYMCLTHYIWIHADSELAIVILRGGLTYALCQPQHWTALCVWETFWCGILTCIVDLLLFGCIGCVSKSSRTLQNVRHWLSRYSTAI